MTLPKLIQYFHRQAAFTELYSPLYQRLFASVAGWLETAPDDSVVKWLLDAGAHRSPIETSMLLMSGMHREVLLQAPGTELLREYYPSVGGKKSHNDEDLPQIFRAAVEKRMDSLTNVLQNGTVQTNETARGVFWLLPTVLTHWPTIHLVDLGASAGLNLVADQRCFEFRGSSDGRVSLLGLADKRQFVSICEPTVPRLWTDEFLAIPTILSRSGCDLHPFPLKTDVDRKTLKSFVWADQVERFDRLEEGIAAYEAVSKTMPITVLPANLPDDLPKFLLSLSLEPEAPIVIYNTYMTTYLRNEGRDMRDHIAKWAEDYGHTVLWVQAEPPREEGMVGPPGEHWCAWTVDLWEPTKEHQRWHIGWVHPHATLIKWLDSDLSAFVNYFG